MGENSGIQWTDHTFNPWIGCTKVSPGCDHCYAESYANRYGKAVWGPGQPRQLTGDTNWKKPLKWNHEAMLSGARPRVFCASLADVFDNEVPDAWRYRLWDLIEATPNLDWLLLTKRIGNSKKMMKARWLDYPMPNVWLGISVVNQEEADRDIPKLIATPAAIRFLSMEPLLGPVDLFTEHFRVFSIGDEMTEPNLPPIDWVIVGGESGPGARPMHPDWARALRDQCAMAGVAFHFKQWGEWQVVYDRDVEDPDWRSCPRAEREGERYVNLAGGHGFHGERVCFARRVGKKASGRLLDGREWNGLPVAA